MGERVRNPKRLGWPMAVLALLGTITLACGVPAGAHAAAPDSSRANGRPRLMSKRALIELAPLPPRSAAEARAADSLGLPSPGAATALSVAGAGVPVLFFLGVASSASSDAAALGALAFSIVGPGLGYYYGGAASHALPGTLIRVGSVLLLGEAWLLAWDSGEADARLLAASLVGGAGYIGATFYDMGNVGPVVRRANEQRLARAVPVLGLRALHDGSPALAFQLRF